MGLCDGNRQARLDSLSFRDTTATSAYLLGDGEAVGTENESSHGYTVVKHQAEVAQWLSVNL